MKAAEFLIEELAGTIHFSRMNVQVSSHAIDRVREPERKVYYKKVDPIIKKLPAAMNKIRQIPSGQQFYVYDATADISLGMRRYDDINDTVVLRLNTVMGWQPDSRVHTPIIEV